MVVFALEVTVKGILTWNPTKYAASKGFRDGCSRHCYIGLCYGWSSVGKRASAGRYSRWDIFNQVQLFTTASLRAFDGSMDI
jgi:hypothetical protein